MEKPFARKIGALNTWILAKTPWVPWVKLGSLTNYNTQWIICNKAIANNSIFFRNLEEEEDIEIHQDCRVFPFLGGFWVTWTSTMELEGSRSFSAVARFISVLLQPDGRSAVIACGSVGECIASCFWFPYFFFPCFYFFWINFIPLLGY